MRSCWPENPLASEVELLISCGGITPLVAPAFLAGVAEVESSGTLQKMKAYLGFVPRAGNSGGKNRPGHINRESRKLTRTILTQRVQHVASCLGYLQGHYRELTARRRSGRVRIALIRKLCGMMRRTPGSGQQYRWIDQRLYEKKLKAYEIRFRRSHPSMAAP